MKPIRILHIVGIMNMGGLENLIMNVYRCIDREKVQFDFLVTREDEGIFDKEIKSLGGRIYNIPHISKIGYLKYKKAIYDFLKSHEEYKIVHCHRDAMCSVYLNQAKKLSVPVRIAHSHSSKISEQKNLKGLLTTIIKKILIKNTKSSATDYLACSNDAGKWLFGSNISLDQLNIINNGIYSDKYIYDDTINLKIRKKLNISKDTLLIGHVGRFEIPKNHDFLIDIIDRLDKYIKNYKLCLVGDGRLIDNIKRKVKERELEDKVIFLGIKDNVNELMMAFDILAFPSLFEGLPIVLVEAQATGLRCFVSNRVSNEADMNVGLFEHIPINNIDLWAIKMNEFYNQREFYRNNRFSNIDRIKENKYDILDTAKYLENFYIENSK